MSPTGGRIMRKRYDILIYPCFLVKTKSSVLKIGGCETIPSLSEGLFPGGTVSFRECIQLIQSYKKTQSFLRAWKRFIERLPANHPNFQSVDSSQKPGSQYGLIPNPCLSHGRSCKGL